MDEETGFLAEESPTKKFFARAAGVVAFVVASFLVREGFHYLRNRPVTPSQLEAQAEAEPELRDTFLALRQNYPREADAFFQQAAASANAGDREAARRSAFLFMRNFMQSKVGAITSGPAATLHAIAVEYSALLHVFRTNDVAMCAQFSMVGLTPGQMPPRQALEHLNRISVLQISAAHDGESAARTPRQSLADADQASWLNAIRAIDASLIPLFANESALSTAPVARQCDAGVALYDAAAELPTEASANVTAYLIKNSLSQSR